MSELSCEPTTSVIVCSRCVVQTKSPTGRAFSKYIAVSSLVAILSSGVLPTAIAQTWFEDFTDGVLGDDVVDGSPGGVEWAFDGEHELTIGSGLRLFNTEQPIRSSSRAVATNVGLTRGWSIRATGRLLPGTSNNRLGVLITPSATSFGGGARVDLHDDGFADAQGDDSNLLVPVVTGESSLNPLEDVVIQFDTFDGVLEAWMWKPGSPPAVGDPPLLRDDEELLTTVFGEIWEPSSPGVRHFDTRPGSSAIWSTILMSTEHIPLAPVPEPTGAAIIVLGLTITNAFWSRKRSTHRTI